MNPIKCPDCAMRFDDAKFAAIHLRDEHLWDEFTARVFISQVHKAA